MNCLEHSICISLSRPPNVWKAILVCKLWKLNKRKNKSQAINNSILLDTHPGQKLALVIVVANDLFCPRPWIIQVTFLKSVKNSWYHYKLHLFFSLLYTTVVSVKPGCKKITQTIRHLNKLLKLENQIILQIQFWIVLRISCIKNKKCSKVPFMFIQNFFYIK